MKRYVAEIRFPELDEPIYLGSLVTGEKGYAPSIASADLFDDPEMAVRVAVSWAPSLEPFVTAVEVDA